MSEYPLNPSIVQFPISVRELLVKKVERRPEKNFARLRKNLGWNNFFAQCPIFSTTSQGNLNYHVARKRSASIPKTILYFKE